MKRTLLVTSLFIGWFAYFLTTPVPTGFENPWKIRIFEGLFDLQQKFALWGDFFGYDSWINLTRRVSVPPGFPDRYLYDQVEVTNDVFDGIPIRIFKSIAALRPEPLPAMIYYHGGGWVLGSLDLYDPLGRRLAIESGIAIITIEYRLAPENPFPASLEDCYKVTLQILRRASELGIDRSRVVIGGDSAGGNLAAAIAQRMKRVDPPFLAQILLYPVMQSFDFQLPSYKKNWTPIVNGAHVPPFFLLYMFGSYNLSFVDAMYRGAHLSASVRERYSRFVDYRRLPQRFRQDYVEPTRPPVDEEIARVLEPYILNPEIHPLMSEDLTGLPEAIVVTGDHDVLRDEGTLYAVRLKDAGVAVQHWHYEHGFHGMIIFTEEPFRFATGMNVLKDMSKFMREKTRTAA